MDKESDVIKHQMEHTRSALTDKLEALEHQVTDTVTGAAETVEKVRQTVQETVSGAKETVANMQHAFQDTVDSVKESVRETAESVSETLDLRKQVQKHPWTMMAGATAVGFGVGVLVSRVDMPAAASGASSSMASSARSLANAWNGSEGDHSPAWTASQREQGYARQQPASCEESPWTPAVNQFKGLALGAMFGVLRDVLAQSLPDTLRGQVGDVIDNFTKTMGGKPIAGKVLPDSWSAYGERGPSQSSHENRQFRDGNGQSGSRRPRQTAMADIEE